MFKRAISLIMVMIFVMSLCPFAMAENDYEIVGSRDNLVLSEGGTEELKLVDAKTKKDAELNVLWLSSDPLVASVSSDGTVSAKKIGTAEISCVSSTGKTEYAKCKLEVVAKVTGLKLNKTEETLTLGAEKTLSKTQLEYEIMPSDAYFDSVVWSSSDETVVRVDNNGVIEAIGQGSAVITAVSNDPMYTGSAQCKFIVNQAITSLSAKKQCILYVGDSETLEVSILPENATNKALIWESSNPDIANVDANGRITAKSVGKTDIICTALDAGARTCKCTVEVRAHVQGLSLSENKITLLLGLDEEANKKSIGYSTAPENAYDKKVLWSSSDESVATVDEDGLVTALSLGTTTVSATTSDTSYTGVASCEVQVYQAVTGIKIPASEILYTGNSIVLEPVIEPDNASVKTVKWESSNPDIASVDNNGKVIAKAVGKAVISCTSNDGGNIKEKCAVEVRAAVKGLSIEGNTSLLLGAGEEAAISQLSAVTNPADAFVQTVTWSSSDESIVSVDENGLITANSFGKAIISAISDDTEYQTPANVEVSVTQAVMVVSLSQNKGTIYTGTSLKLDAAVSPEDAANKAVAWSSSNDDIASVDANGNVNAKNVGDVTITCSAVDGSGIKAACTLKIIAAVKGLTLSETKAQLVLGAHEDAAKLQLEYALTPEDAYVQTVSWASSDESVATVDENGLVTAVNDGEVIITALSDDEAYQTPASCNITVGQAVRTISLGEYNNNMAKGSSQKIISVIQPEKPLNPKLEWSSNNETVVQVDANGNVKAVGVGKATVTCAATDGSNVVKTIGITVYQSVTGITTSKNNIIVFEGDTATLDYKVGPDDATDKSVTWSSDSACVSVGNGGVVEGKYAGTAIITAMANDGSGKTCKYTVTVEPACPITLTGLGTGIYNGSLLSLTFKNKCAKTTVKDIYFDVKLLAYDGSTISSGSYHTDTIYLGPGASYTLKRTLSGVAYAAKYQVSITGIKMNDGTDYFVPFFDIETSTWGS